MRHLLSSCLTVKRPGRTIIPAIALFFFSNVHATIWNVGPTRTYTYCSQVAGLVQNGDTILIDAATYSNDPQVIWNKSNLYIAGNGGRPRLEAGSIIANDMVNGKGIFVISGANVHVHNIEFANTVVQDNNGAGIRQEGPNLFISSCKFTNNEMGILGGNIPDCKTTVEYCEFVHGGSTLNPGYQHNIYINHIDTLVFRYNYTYDAIAEGHELKSRATYNFILFNRIANETSEDSRTIDLPNGGTSVIIGNIITQGPGSANSNLLGYGLEGLTNPASHSVFCCSNTFINEKSTGSFIQVANGTETLFVKNNIFAGAHTGGIIVGTPTVMDSSNNAINSVLSGFGFVDPGARDYHLVPDASMIDRGVGLSETVLGYALQPKLEYQDTCFFTTRADDGKIDIGAFEYTFPLNTHEYFPASVEVFPNPASDAIQVDVAPADVVPSTIRVLNLNGRIVMSCNLYSGKNTIDVSSLSEGIYFICLSGKGKPTVRKIIIQ
jgi:Secretion system C-terminal sorting domain